MKTKSVRKYTFYILVEAKGGSKVDFGPYTLVVGCSEDSIVWIDNIETTSYTITPGTFETFNFDEPSTGRSYCEVELNEISTSSGGSLSISGLRLSGTKITIDTS